ncbi:MAG: phospholipase [Clostridia bacterium]|nr:phospholipase [Clostridia bacterium]
MKIEQVKHSIFNYCLCRPTVEGPKKPLIVFLHGAGERGDDLSIVPKNGLRVVEEQDLELDCYIVAPQCPADTFWAARVESIKEFIDDIVKTYDIDTNRISLTGISMGGFGTWFTAMAYPDMFCAIAPCCGGGMPWNARVLKMPVKAFHGDKDVTVLPSCSIDMIDALMKSPDRHSDVSLTLYHNIGHNSWDIAYDEALFKWLISYSK